jgi:hypothetical protein
MSAVHGDELRVPAALPPGERALGTNWIGGWVGPRADLDAAIKGKSSPLLEFELKLPRPITIFTELPGV